MIRFLPVFVRRWLYRFLELTPFVRKPAVSLQPWQQIQPLAGAPFNWQATGSEPRFLWQSELPAAGWYMLEVTLCHDQPLAGLRVVFEGGEGSSSFFLPLKAGRLTKRLCRVPRQLQRVWVDPMGSAGCFSFDHFRFARVSAGMALDRLARRLVNMHYIWQETGVDDVVPGIRKEAREAGSDWLALAEKYYEETFERLSIARSYPQWQLRNPPLAAWDIAGVVAPAGFVFEVLLVAERPDRTMIMRSFEALKSQIWGNWSLTVLLSSEMSEPDRDWFSEWAATEQRVALVMVEGMLPALELAIKASSAEWVVVIEPGDALSPDAFWWVAQEAGKAPESPLLYSDEDWLDETGGRYAPSFRPDWNPDLFLSCPYTGKALWFKPSAYSSDILRFGDSLAGWRYGLMLQLAIGAGAPVQHVPRVLFHSRSADVSEQKWAEEDCELAYRQWSEAWPVRRGVQTERVAGGLWHRYPVPEPAPLVSLLIPTRNGIEILEPCVNAILERTTYPNFEVLILDNQSDCPRALSYMQSVSEQDARVRVLRWDYPFNYSAVNNFGVQAARGAVIGLINNDIEPINGDWLNEMMGQVLRPEIGCVGAKLYYPNDTIQHGGVILGIGGVAGHSHKYLQRAEDGYEHRLKLVQNLSAVTGACLLVRKSVFEEVGGLDAENLAVAFNDVDFCLKVREAGYRNLWTPFAEAYHHESVSRGADDTPKKRHRANREADYMKQRWGAVLQQDPAYNPNLTLIHEDFSLR